jgi:CRISPR/Cas system-associated protein Cas5 (RAMP superfamily)
MIRGSWKTTITGILTIIVAVGGAALHYMQTGELPPIGTLIGAIMAGVGLLTARDNDVTSEEAGAKKPASKS